MPAVTPDSNTILRLLGAPTFCCNVDGEIVSPNEAAVSLMDGDPQSCWRATISKLINPGWAAVWSALATFPTRPVVLRGTLTNGRRTPFVCTLAITPEHYWAIAILIEAPLLEAVETIAHAIIREDSLDPILKLVTNFARRLCGGHRSYIKLYNEESGRLLFQALSSEIAHEMFPERESAANRGLTGEAFKTKQVLNSPNVNDDGRYFRLFDDTQSELVAPLLVERRARPRSPKQTCLGVLAVHSREPQAFNSESEYRARLMALFGALAVHESQVRGGIQVTYGQLLTEVRNTQDSLYARALLHDASNFLREIEHRLKGLGAELRDRSFSGKIVAQLDDDRRALAAKNILMRDLIADLARSRGNATESQSSDLVIVASQISDALLPREEGIDLQLETDADEHLVAAKASDLRLVLFNLVNNSLRAIRHAKGVGTVRIVIAEAAKRPGFTRIEVIDDGPGLTKDIREALQLSLSASATPGGLGLGLLTVRQRVLAFHGSIDVAGRHGEGTTIRIDIPSSKRSDE